MKWNEWEREWTSEQECLNDGGSLGMTWILSVSHIRNAERGVHFRFSAINWLIFVIKLYLYVFILIISLIRIRIACAFVSKIVWFVILIPRVINSKGCKWIYYVIIFPFFFIWFTNKIPKGTFISCKRDVFLQSFTYSVFLIHLKTRVLTFTAMYLILIGWKFFSFLDNLI